MENSAFTCQKGVHRTHRRTEKKLVEASMTPTVATAKITDLSKDIPSFNILLGFELKGEDENHLNNRSCIKLKLLPKEPASYLFTGETNFWFIISPKQR